VSVNTGYEASKLARERYGEYFSNHYDMSAAGMRFFSVYQGYGGAEEHKGEYANVIAQFADDIADGEAPVLYGDGTQTRDFTHVSDIVRGLELAAVRELDGIYNLGTGGVRFRDRRRDDQRRTRYRCGSGVRREPDSRFGLRPRHLRRFVEDPSGDWLGTTDRLRGGYSARLCTVHGPVARFCVDSHGSDRGDFSNRSPRNEGGGKRRRCTVAMRTDDGRADCAIVATASHLHA